MQSYSPESDNEQPEAAKKSHWENIYSTKGARQVSWYAPHLELSLQLIKESGVSRTGQIIDVGGGASTLVDDLLEKGYEHLSVLDISLKAIQSSKARLGIKAKLVQWIEADVTQVDLPQNHFDIWHDRAVFHFLTQAGDRRRYLNLVKSSLKSRGRLIIGTFADDGPSTCSGLEVVRYSVASLRAEVGEDFEFVEGRNETHSTPFNTEQKFLYGHFKKRL
jgi:SAM-dependent methyltransferase